MVTQAAWMAEVSRRAGDEDLAARAERLGRACRRYLDGEPSTIALQKEGL